ncbi:MAG TPA: hypothetical protein VEF04_18555, partial [Blastocatellia bacterium]|nr:hypothetical protein [Blastocatellia bacterium]
TGAQASRLPDLRHRLIAVSRASELFSIMPSHEYWQAGRLRSSHQTSMKTLVVLFFAILAQTLGDVLLTKGMKSVGEVNTLVLSELFAIGWQVFTNPIIWLGIGLLFVFFVLYLTALTWADLSYVLPVTAFGYTLNAVMAKYLLGEHISLLRWVGTLVICIGVAVVSRTEQKTTNSSSQQAGSEAV